ncbi:uncharacterized protein MONBRDRAFT_33234 [Monosiga brevicollis MX1]|uniref:Programmed cell death protein 10 dimerisation domain-containing protein n=1 Tax=Monosiga brevicollis TaxID=81824 RepID=A9V4A4_MONBE|nr:uncharacterized protein MONBRDRAFT_33234 [Monosiga brevicollis MX1]EDQ87674.1 predicted protein [Monosiga brevicollis MX1]|eukprot:XP_001747594.1 hypothetical protein [Monosiga brevicollis MX1]
MTAPPAASIALHAVVFPSIEELEQADASAAAALQSLRAALEKAEAHNPGFVHEFVDQVLERAQSKGGTDISEQLLRKANSDIESYRFDTKTPELKDLLQRAEALKEILSTIPDEVQNRTRFLGIIRKIAESIKEVLDAVNAVATNNADVMGDHITGLQQQRKTFVRGSKSFSDTLKQYFKDNKAPVLFKAAHRLIDQTNSLLRTIKAAVDA